MKTEKQAIIAKARAAPGLPAEAMYINDTTLEDQVSGYRTLNVTGRELIGYGLDTTNVSGRDGPVVNSANLPARKIVVEYRLKAPDDEAFRQAYDQLQLLLSGGRNSVLLCR